MGDVHLPWQGVPDLPESERLPAPLAGCPGPTWKWATPTSPSRMSPTYLKVSDVNLPWQGVPDLPESGRRPPPLAGYPRPSPPSRLPGIAPAASFKCFSSNYSYPRWNLLSHSLASILLYIVPFSWDDCWTVLSKGTVSGGFRRERKVQPTCGIHQLLGLYNLLGTGLQYGTSHSARNFPRFSIHSTV